MVRLISVPGWHGYFHPPYSTITCMSNIAKGRNSVDAQIGDIDVAFINHNVSEYPITVGAPNFAPAVVEKQRDIELNVAREHAKQEYERIMEMVRILQEQAKQLVDRVDATELVHETEYSILINYSTVYYVYRDTYKNKNVLTVIGPDNWCAGPPSYYEFLAAVRKKGDSTWEYVTE